LQQLVCAQVSQAPPLSKESAPQLACASLPPSSVVVAASSFVVEPSFVVPESPKRSGPASPEFTVVVQPAAPAMAVPTIPRVAHQDRNLIALLSVLPRSRWGGSVSSMKTSLRRYPKRPGTGQIRAARPPISGQS